MEKLLEGQNLYTNEDTIRMIYNDSVWESPIPKRQYQPARPLCLYEFKQRGGCLETVEVVDLGRMSRMEFTRLASIIEKTPTLN